MLVALTELRYAQTDNPELQEILFGLTHDFLEYGAVGYIVNICFVEPMEQEATQGLHKSLNTLKKETPSVAKLAIASMADGIFKTLVDHNLPDAMIFGDVNGKGEIAKALTEDGYSEALSLFASKYLTWVSKIEKAGQIEKESSKQKEVAKGRKKKTEVPKSKKKVTPLATKSGRSRTEAERGKRKTLKPVQKAKTSNSPKPSSTSALLKRTARPIEKEPTEIILTQDRENRTFFKSGKQLLMDKKLWEEFLKWLGNKVNTESAVDVSIECHEFQLGVRRFEVVEGWFLNKRMDTKIIAFVTAPNTQKREATFNSKLQKKYWTKVRGEGNAAVEYVHPSGNGNFNITMGKRLIEALRAHIDVYNLKGQVVLTLKVWNDRH